MPCPEAESQVHSNFIILAQRIFVGEWSCFSCSLLRISLYILKMVLILVLWKNTQGLSMSWGAVDLCASQQHDCLAFEPVLQFVVSISHSSSFHLWRRNAQSHPTLLRGCRESFPSLWASGAFPAAQRATCTAICLCKNILPFKATKWQGKASPETQKCTLCWFTLRV